MAVKLSWCSDLAAENNLRRMGVVFDVGTVPFSKLDLKESQVNGARLGDPLVRSLIEDYVQGMVNGDTFPRPILHPGKSGWIILSGNQRCAAIQQLIKDGELPQNVQVEAYKLDECDKLLREIIARSANTVHGGRSEKDERTAHAVYCVRALGMNVEDAAKAFVVSRTGINIHVRAEKERDSLLREGVDVSRMAVKTLDSLSRLPFDSNAKKQLAFLAVQHDVSADRLMTAVKEVKAAKTQQDRTAKVKAFERELAEQSRATSKPETSNGRSKAPSRPRRDRMLRAMESLVVMLEKGNDGGPFTTLDQLQFSGETDTARLKALVGRLTLRWNVLGV